MLFGKALATVQSDECRAIRMPQWSSDVEIKVQRPDEHSKMTAPYLYVESRFGLVPWIPTQIEMFSEDWELIE